MTQSFLKGGLAGIVAIGFAAADLVVVPVSHDFGAVAVGNIAAKNFLTVVFAEAAPTKLSITVAGPDAVDFTWSPEDQIDPFALCQRDSEGGAGCKVEVEFRPRSRGSKTARLMLIDSHGHSATALLKGMATAALCTPTVVPCNYALHYSGVVSWADLAAGVTVDVIRGVASCNVLGESEFASGPGLIAVEFDRSDEQPSPFYRITVACPIRYPPEPARPAELGHGEFGSYKQPLAMRVEDVQKGPPRLKGQEDVVSWNLCPHAQYVPAARVPVPGRTAATDTTHNPCPDPP